MPGVRLILALHNHQPVGNFDGVFEAAYRDSYLPFLDVHGRLSRDPVRPAHLGAAAGVARRAAGPSTSRRVRALVEAGRVEILGGGFYEPILTMIPHRDRVGQIRAYSRLPARSSSARRSAGMWVPERVWEQHLVSALAEAGIEYTVLDDFHFQRAGPGRGRPLRLLPDRGRRPPAQGLPRLRAAPLPDPVPGAARDLRIPPAAGRASSPARRSSSPTTARSSAPGPRRYDHVYTQRLAPPVLRHDRRQPRLARADHASPGRRRDPAAGQGLPARLRRTAR